MFTIDPLWLASLLDNFSRFALSLILLILVLLLSNPLANRVGKRFRKRIEDKLLADFLVSVFRWTFIILGIAACLSILGLHEIATGIFTGASVSAVVIGFAFKDIGENLLAGVMMAFSRPFRVGDQIEVTKLIGKVKKIDIRYTNIVTPEGQDIFIPNSQILKNPVTNFAYEPTVRFEIVKSLGIDVDYEKPANKAIEIIAKFDNVADIDYVIGADGDKVNIKFHYWIDVSKLGKDQSAEKHSGLIAYEVGKYWHKLTAKK